MIPQSSLNTQDVVTGDTMPNKTYKWDRKRNRIQGFIDDKEAIEQMIYKTLNTERYMHLIYSFNYGIELENLLGQDIIVVKADLKRRIEEALKQDGRIEAVDNFEILGGEERDAIVVKFEAITTIGMINVERSMSL